MSPVNCYLRGECVRERRVLQTASLMGGERVVLQTTSVGDDGGWGLSCEDLFLVLKSVVEFFIYYFCLRLFTSIYCLPTFVLVVTRFL
jgi:hypothetical protein